MDAVSMVAAGLLGLFCVGFCGKVLADAAWRDWRDQQPRIWVPKPPFEPAIVIEGMIEDASRCGEAEYADLDRTMMLRLAPELEEPWAAVYQGRCTYHPSVREAGLSLLRRALAHTPPARRAPTQRSVT